MTEKTKMNATALVQQIIGQTENTSTTTDMFTINTSITHATEDTITIPGEESPIMDQIYLKDPPTQNYLTHYGVLGMRWGVRKDRRSSGSSTRKKISSGKSRVKKAFAKRKAANAKKKAAKNTNPKKMTDAELKKRIERLELEKKYTTLSNEQISKGKKMIADISSDIMKQSVKNIGTQAMTYILGTATNKAFSKFVDDPEVVNPKKGQKDKK